MKNSKNIFLKIYKDLVNNGRIITARGLKCLEVENFSYDFPPFVRFPSFKDRKYNLDYVKREFLWYINADKYDLSILEHAKIWKDCVTKNKTINSNYGQYIFPDQFKYVIETLIKDKESRRASIIILSMNHILSGDYDLPCTLGLNFRIRNNKLNMSVNMRSQDAIYGFASDIPIFSFIHEMVFIKLKDYYKELEIGNYYHSVNSFHIYERHFQMIVNILENQDYIEIDCPKIKDSSEVDFILNKNYIKIPKKYKFIKWLNTYDDKKL